MNTEVKNELESFAFTRALGEYVQAGNFLLHSWESIPEESDLETIVSVIKWPFAMSFNEYMIEMKSIYTFISKELGYE